MKFGLVTNLDISGLGLAPSLVVPFTSLEQASVKIDEYKYQQRKPLDFVLFLTNPVHRFDDFVRSIPYIGENSDTVHLTGIEKGFNFYSTPETFAMIAAAHKIPLNTYSQWTNAYQEEDDIGLKILYSVARLALSVKLIA
jgi:hypothetical protein